MIIRCVLPAISITIPRIKVGLCLKTFFCIKDQKYVKIWYCKAGEVKKQTEEVKMGCNINMDILSGLDSSG